MIAVGTLSHASPPSQRRDVFDEIRVSTDIGWLEKLVMEPGAAEAATQPFYNSNETRSYAYVRLGAIGSAGSIAAINRIEEAVRAWSLVPPVGLLGADFAKPFAQATSPDGLTFAVVQLRRLGGVDAFLVTSRTRNDSSSWSRPLLLPNRSWFGLANPQLTIVDAQRLQLDFDIPGAADTNAYLRPFMPVPPSERRPDGRQSWSIPLTAVIRDTDGDGWTDLEERRLGLNWQNRDSDGDGTLDSKDVCPAYAASPLESGDTEAAIIQKVFFAGYGVRGSPNVLLVGGSSRPVQLWGSRGPVLYGVDRSSWLQNWGSAPTILSWKLKSLTTDGGFETALVEFSDYDGPLAAHGYSATLRRISGEWVVVNVTMTWIS